MTKTGVVSCCIASALVGIAVGTGLAFLFGGSLVDTGIMGRAEADIVVGSSLLEQIESGELHGATALLNAQLDSALVTLDAFARQGLPPKPGIYKSLDRIKRMRSKTNYAPHDAQVAESVNRALNLGSPQ